MKYVGVLLLLLSSGVFAGTSAQVTAISDYTFNGITQTNGESAIQMSIEQEVSSGFYYGLWASQVNFHHLEDEHDIKTGIDDDQVELDSYFGYRWSQNDIDYDAGAVLFSYFGGTSTTESDYSEYYIYATVDTQHTVGLRCSFDYPADDGHATHCILHYNYSFPKPIYGVDTALQFNYSNSLDNDFTPWGDKKRYLHSKLSFSRTVDAFTVTLDLENTWGSDVAGGGFRSVLGVSYAFDWE